MEVGEIWGYREPPHVPGKPLIPVEIRVIGPGSRQLRVCWLSGDHKDLEQWVTRKRLIVPWEIAEPFLADEIRFDRVANASNHVYETVECEAAESIIDSYPRKYTIQAGYRSATAGTVTIADLDAVCSDLNLSRKELVDEPLTYFDRHSAYVAPWPVTLRIAKRIAEVYTQVVLDDTRKLEKSLEDKATSGIDADWATHDGYSTRETTDFYSTWLHKQQPLLALIRTWCGEEPVSRFNEAEALRLENERLRGLILEAAQWLQESRHPNIAARLRKEVGADVHRRARHQ